MDRGFLREPAVTPGRLTICPNDCLYWGYGLLSSPV